MSLATKISSSTINTEGVICDVVTVEQFRVGLADMFSTAVRAGDNPKFRLWFP